MSASALLKVSGWNGLQSKPIYNMNDKEDLRLS